MLLNPNTHTCPIFLTHRDAEITKDIYGRIPVLVRERPSEDNPWKITFKQGLFNMSSDSHLFRSRQQLEREGSKLVRNVFLSDSSRFLPLYEAKMVYQFNHRFADYRNKPKTSDSSALPQTTEEELCDPGHLALPRYWVNDIDVENSVPGLWRHSWFLAWRDITNSASERTMIAAILPRVALVGELLIAFPSSFVAAALLLANLNAFILDFCARQKVGGLHLKFFTMRQLPILPPHFYHSSSTNLFSSQWVIERVLELTFTAMDLRPFGADFQYQDSPFVWDSGRRFLIRAELDAAFFHLYGVSRHDIGYIMDTFSLVRARDEEHFGEYRTKRLILETYDAMADAIRTGCPYQTRLDPPPGDPRAAHTGSELETGQSADQARDRT
jgi:hypothetical protein